MWYWSEWLTDVNLCQCWETARRLCVAVESFAQWCRYNQRDSLVYNIVTAYSVISHTINITLTLCVGASRQWVGRWIITQSVELVIFRMSPSWVNVTLYNDWCLKWWLNIIQSKDQTDKHLKTAPKLNIVSPIDIVSYYICLLLHSVWSLLAFFLK